MAGGFGQNNIRVVNEAAKKAGIPFWVLWGVYGAESTWGKNGSNWFGLTSVPRTGTFQGDANRSAETLARLYNETGKNWDAALHQYSGGSYGETHIKELVHQSEPTPKEKQQAEKETLIDPLTGKPSTNIPQKFKEETDKLFKTFDLKQIAEVLNFITSGAGWVRIGKVVFGTVILLFALSELIKIGSGSNAPSLPVKAGHTALDLAEYRILS